MTGKLSSEAVDRVFIACAAESGDTCVDGIVHRYCFDKGKLAEHDAEIKALLAELPDPFHTDKGGGWSFLNACDDRHGNQWTGFQMQMEKLFCLGIAAEHAKWLLPRDMWDILPGGMPYVCITLDN